MDGFKIIANNYVYNYPNPPSLLLERLEKFQADHRELTAYDLTKKLFELHNGMHDSHFSYQIDEHIFEFRNSGKKKVF